MTSFCFCSSNFESDFKHLFWKCLTFWSGFAANVEFMTFVLILIEVWIWERDNVSFYANGQKNPKKTIKTQNKKNQRLCICPFCFFFSGENKLFSGKIRIIFSLGLFQQLPKYIFKHIVPHRTLLAINSMHQNVHQF